MGWCPYNRPASILGPTGLGDNREQGSWLIRCRRGLDGAAALVQVKAAGSACASSNRMRHYTYEPASGQDILSPFHSGPDRHMLGGRRRSGTRPPGDSPRSRQCAKVIG